MTKDEIKKSVDEFLIEELEIEPDRLSDNANLKEDVGIDSLDFVDIVVLVEEKFGFKIKAEDMYNVRTLSQFYDYIEKQIQ